MYNAISETIMLNLVRFSKYKGIEIKGWKYNVIIGNQNKK